MITCCTDFAAENAHFAKSGTRFRCSRRGFMAQLPEFADMWDSGFRQCRNKFF
jgi:hypothetical protein